MFTKIHEKLDSLIGCTNKLLDYIIGISGTLGKMLHEFDAIRQELSTLNGKVDALERTVSMLHDVRASGEMEQGIENIMNYGRRVKKDG